MIYYILILIALTLITTHILSYYIIKTKILNENKWDLNICCGKTDGGGVNADIYKHEELPNFVLLNNIYNLPFKDREFKKTLCSHTMEHVDDPKAFFDELSRVSTEVTIVIPPLYDIFAAFNIFEHKHIFITLRKKHHKLPFYINFTLANIIHKIIGQRNHA